MIAASVCYKFMSASSLKCPSCKRPLCIDYETRDGKNIIWTYCSFGPCQPYLLNDGGSGFTVELAYRDLCRMYRDWMEEGIGVIIAPVRSAGAPESDTILF